MVQSPDSPGHGAREWPDRRAITPALAAMLTGARRARGLSLRQAARRAGCSAGTIAHLEKGRRAPSVITAQGIIDAYQLGPREAEWLMAEAVDDAGKSSPWKGRYA
jgi:transcriptional regulator with XRE-family HTH domain